MTLELPGADPGLRRALLYRFHARLCHRSGPGPERHRPAGGSENRRPAACWLALAAVDDVVGDLDELLLDLRARTADAERAASRSAARHAELEAALGLIPPAVAGEVAGGVVDQ